MKVMKVIALRPLFHLIRRSHLFDPKCLSSAFKQNTINRRLITTSLLNKIIKSNEFNSNTIKSLSKDESKLKSSYYYEKRIHKIKECLIKSFALQLEEVENIFENYPDFNDIEINDLQNKITFLDEKQLISKELAIKSSWILLIDKITLINGIQFLNNLKLLDSIRNGKTYILAAFLWDTNRMKYISKKFPKNHSILSDFHQRMDFFCRNLNIKRQIFCSLIELNFQLVTKSMDHIQKVYHLLKQNGISNEDLLKDHWIFIHNIEIMEKRIKECIEFKHPIKTWVLRCPDHIWYPILNRKRNNLDALGKEPDTKSLLMKLLNCNEYDINYLKSKNKRLFTISPQKIEQMIHILNDFGYTFNDIMDVPRIFNYGIQRVKTRLSDPRHKSRPNLEIIFLSEEDYNDFSFEVESNQNQLKNKIIF